MDKAEALAYVSRLFDAAQAGAAVWGDALLIKRFITQCSRRTQSAAYQGHRAAYRFEINGVLSRAGDRAITHTCICGRSTAEAFCQDWVSQLREQVLKPSAHPCHS